MSGTPPISRAYARRCLTRILQVITVLGAFWALSACISTMREKEQAAASAPVRQIHLNLVKPPEDYIPPTPPPAAKPARPEGKMLMKGTKAAMPSF